MTRCNCIQQGGPLAGSPTTAMDAAALTDFALSKSQCFSNTCLQPALWQQLLCCMQQLLNLLATPLGPTQQVMHHKFSCSRAQAQP
jgi:hypothetical protein